MPEQLDDFDRSLRDRIGAAEARVRVSSAAPGGGAAAPGPSRWLRPVLVAATAAVAVVLAVLVIGQLPDRSVGDASPSPSAGEGVSASARNGDLVLTLSSPRSMWTTEDAIEITATLSYDGDEPEVDIFGAGGPIVFSLVQVEGGTAVLGGGQRMPCLQYRLGPDAPLVQPFQKSGGVDDGPPFDRAFFDDPDLHLPPGRWDVRAELDYGEAGCQGIQQLAVSISLGVMEAAEPPGPSPVATEPPVSSSLPSATTPPRPTTDLTWTRTGAFPTDGTSMVTQVVSVDGALVAIGLEYDVELRDVGPEPLHAARAWISSDGREWEPIDLGDDFRNADLGTVITLPDGSLLALGDRYRDEDGDQLSIPSPAAWTSTDGRTWRPIAYPVERPLVGIVQGAHGYLASVDATPGTSERVTIWHSVDGRAWSQVHEFGEAEYVIALDAGSEGFAVSGAAVRGDGILLASGDGIAWHEATSLPSGAFIELAAIDGDWLAMRGYEPAVLGETYSSSNALDWSLLGRAALETIQAGDSIDETCTEAPHYLASSGLWLVMGTFLSPCSEGGFVVHGTAQISLDGATWTRLPFDAGIPGQPRSGSAVNASAVLDGNLILAGEQNGVATFWIGEPR